MILNTGVLYGRQWTLTFREQFLLTNILDYAGTREILLNECCFLMWRYIYAVLCHWKTTEILIAPRIGGQKKETMQKYFLLQDCQKITEEAYMNSYFKTLGPLKYFKCCWKWEAVSLRCVIELSKYNKGRVHYWRLYFMEILKEFQTACLGFENTSRLPGICKRHNGVYNVLLYFHYYFSTFQAIGNGFQWTLITIDSLVRERKTRKFKSVLDCLELPRN